MVPQQQRRRRRRAVLPRTPERRLVVARGAGGFGFTIAGQRPCVVSAVAAGGPAERAGLRAGDALLTVDGANVARAPHASVARLVAAAPGAISLSVAPRESPPTDTEDTEPDERARTRRRHPPPRRRPHVMHHPGCHAAPSTSGVNEILQNLSRGQLTPSHCRLECRAVVGYLGTIETPHAAPSAAPGNVRTAVRKLRQERRPATPVLLSVLPNALLLRRPTGQTLAQYPRERIVYAGCGSEADRRYFGLVTSAETEEEASHSCHVFAVDPRMAEHDAHAPRAREFQIACTRDPVAERCLEFPPSAEYVVGVIRGMYSLPADESASPGLQQISKLAVKGDSPAAGNFSRCRAAFRVPRDRRPGRRDDARLEGQDFVANSPQPSNHSEVTTTSSNSDSGIGFHNDCRNIADRILVVDFAQRPPPEGFARPRRPLGLVGCGFDADGSFLSNAIPVVDGFGGQGRPLNLDDVILNASEQPVRPRVDDGYNYNGYSRANGAVYDKVYSESEGHYEFIPAQLDIDRVAETFNSVDIYEERGEWRSAESVVPEAGTSELKASDSVSVYSSRSHEEARPRQRYLQTSLDDMLVLGLRDPPTNNTDDDKFVHPAAVKCKVRKSLKPLNILSKTRNILSGRDRSRDSRDRSKDSRDRSKDSQDESQDIRNKSKESINSRDKSKDSKSGRDKSKDSKSGRDKSKDSKSGRDKSKESRNGRDAAEGSRDGLNGSQEPRLRDRSCESADGRDHWWPEPLQHRRRTLSAGDVSAEAEAFPPAAASEPDLRDPQSEQSSPFRRWTTAGGAGSSYRHHDHRNMYNKQMSEGTAAVATGGNVSRWSLGLEHLLADPAGAAAFAHFLSKEFAAENIRFWWSCEQYKSIEDSAKRAEMATEIWSRHLAEKASEPVNVDAAARRATALRLYHEPPPQDLFLQAQKQIFNVMKFDSYPRFLRSGVHAECARADLCGRPTPFCEDVPTKASPLKKSASNASERRRSGGASLLPWKLRAPSRDRNPPSPPPATDVVKCGQWSGQWSLCRVVLPDGATSVVGVDSQPVRGLVDRLLARRNLGCHAYDVLLKDARQGEPTNIDLSAASTTIGGREVVVERRVVVRVEVCGRCVCVRCRPTRRLRHVLRPVVARYGPALTPTVLRDGRPVHPDTLMQDLDGARLQVVDSAATECGEERDDDQDSLSDLALRLNEDATDGQSTNSAPASSRSALSNGGSSSHPTGVPSSGPHGVWGGPAVGPPGPPTGAAGAGSRVKAALRPGPPLHHHPPDFLENLRETQRSWQQTKEPRSPPPLPPKPAQRSAPTLV